MVQLQRLLPALPILARAAAGVVCVAAALSVVVGAAGTPLPAAPDLFDDLHARIRSAEEKRQTIRARFTETTVSSLLVKPMVSEGTLVGAKPASLSMTYTSPEGRSIVTDGRRMLLMQPGRDEPEIVDVTQVMKRVDQYFVTARPEQLRQHFTVRAFVDQDVPAWYQIDLVPTRRQIRQGLDRLQIWIARDPLLIAQFRITFAGGDTTTITIRNAELNVPLPADAFKTDIPRPRPK